MKRAPYQLPEIGFILDVESIGIRQSVMPRHPQPKVDRPHE